MLLAESSFNLTIVRQLVISADSYATDYYDYKFSRSCAFWYEAKRTGAKIGQKVKVLQFRRNLVQWL